MNTDFIIMAYYAPSVGFLAHQPTRRTALANEHRIIILIIINIINMIVPPDHS